ncbi:ATP-binding cassette domain-containing protein [Aestuariirhabdus sp. Z084]|uniref:ABC transporter transmembrane domain-containing protein n=1 Tax=Aestuariirhabdus haliotis TaxID=2918751 RepID=UPI00201B4359|nr:ABC transporter transmembrane domain-containing protein [Aestuariirhabdus haliotis]MCL6415508.1 ATP-binding cassette domain-containing protein [Aestuariirhabdus haliotis]MCL6419287.1 ATP-binding cassette domain-containing protein [Aestuariirhabdus haliotis]
MTDTPDDTTRPSPQPASGKPAKKSLSVLLQLWQFVTPYRKTSIAACIALILTAGVSLSIGQGVRLLIDEGFVAQSSQALQQAVVFIVGLSLLMAIGTFTRFYLVSWLGERVSADLRKAVFNHIVTLHPSYFESNRSGEIMSRLTTDTTLLQTIIGSSFSMALRSSLTLIGALILLLITNLKLSLIVLSCVPLVLLPILIYGRRVRKLAKKSQDSIADVGSYAGEIIQHIKTVQSYTRESHERQAFGKEVEAAFEVAKQRVRQRALLIAAVILMVFGAITGMLWVGGNDMLAGRMSGGELGAFVFYAIMMAMSVATISEVYGELQRAAGATERLIGLLNVESLIPPGGELGAPSDTVALNPTEDTQPVAMSENTGHSLLSFNDVSFHYPSRPEQAALHQLNLMIAEGQSLALVGPSGAGKSTLFELLQRFYDPQSGTITLQGNDIRALDPHSLRQQLAVVPQQPALFTADVWYNIRYGKPEASDDEVIAAARAAHAHDFIEALPEGYNSHLGEQGTRLSGGQKQRLAIARAILKDPKILLLDEATSALDAESEFHVQQALETLMKNRTTLIIAHRLATILHADTIVVMDQGQIVAQGKHHELLTRSPLYRRLADLQFQEPERSVS